MTTRLIKKLNLLSNNQMNRIVQLSDMDHEQLVVLAEEIHPECTWESLRAQTRGELMRDILECEHFEPDPE